MPKMKTHKGAAKRLRVTGGGRFRRKRTFHRHKAVSKSAKRKRRLRRAALVHKTEERRARDLLPYS